MKYRVLAVAGLIVSSLAPAAAQDLRGPREQPPPGFSGQQYVDSRGCVFLRGGLGGAVTWVPRISRDRRQVCGQTPSFTPEPDLVAAAPRAPAPAPAPRRAAGDPIDTVATTTTPPRIRDTSGRTSIPAARYAAPVPAGMAAPVVVAAPVPRAAPAPTPAPAPAPAPQVQERLASATPGCPAHAPYGQRLPTTDGRTALLCVRSPDTFPDFARRVGVTSGRVPAPAPAAPDVVARAPVSAVSVAAPVVAPAIHAAQQLADGRVRCPASAPVAQRFELRGGGSTVLCTSGGGNGQMAAGYGPSGQTVAPLDMPSVPKGYRLAWQDDRLNPHRGQMTAQGQAAQDRIWTREVPARLVTDAAKDTRRVTISSGTAPRQTVTVSTSAAPRVAAPAAAATGRFYVQVGSFGVPSNAEGARARLAGMGLPVATGRGNIKGKPVQVIHAGPFASADQARAALVAARRAGFSDAFIR